MAFNANEEIAKVRRAENRISDKITSFAGTIKFVYIHAAWFGVWIVINLGLLGADLAFDKFPFGLLTLIVSLEAIFLSTFVMISQNRQAEAAEIRSELDYKTNVMAEREIKIIMLALKRVAEKQGIDVKDLEDELDTLHKKAGTPERSNRPK
jgi:uncharacterized membrane protein